MESGNYWKYLIELSKNKDTIMKFILWMRIEEFRDIIEKVITVAKMKVKKEWLCKVMGFQR